jgi:hypothetical protein
MHYHVFHEISNFLQIEPNFICLIQNSTKAQVRRKHLETKELQQVRSDAQKILAYIHTLLFFFFFFF